MIRSNEFTCCFSNVTDEYSINDLKNSIDMLLVLRISNTSRKSVKC